MLQSEKKTYHRFFKEDLMDQWTLIEIGLRMNRGLALLTANFGWVSLFLIDKIVRNTKNNLYQQFK